MKAFTKGSVARPVLTAVFVLLITGGLCPRVAEARSVYVIASLLNFGRPVPIRAYDIGPDGRLTFQKEITVPLRGAGAVGIAIDWESENLFITYENTYHIQLVNARKLTDLKVSNAPGGDNLAGIKFDEPKGLLYVIDRGTDKLYVYHWDPEIRKLMLRTGAPYRLEGATGYGIALDEANSLLYVANASKIVTVYDTASWALVDAITLDRTAISIALDTYESLIYTGAGYTGDFYLNRYDMSTGQSTAVQVDQNGGVMGIAVDPTSGCVYVTTGRNNTEGSDDLLVFDRSMTLIDSVTNFVDPTGLVIPAKDLGYNPLNLRKKILVDGQPSDDKIVYVNAGELVTYRLSFENEAALNDVTIVDTLPDYATFETADGDGVSGQYDPGTHTYKWSLGSMAAGSSTSLHLRVRVAQDAPSGAKIPNFATIRTRLYPSTTVVSEAIVTGGDYSPLTVTKEVAIGGQRDGRTVYANPGETVTYSIEVANENNEFPVTGVSVMDTLPAEMSFVDATGDTNGGFYNPADRTYRWSYPALLPTGSAHVELTTQLADDVRAGTVLTNRVTAQTNETSPTTATADIIVSEVSRESLNLTKEITSGGTDADGKGTWYVEPGALVTYSLCFDNDKNSQTVSNVTIVDQLVPELAFIRTGGDTDSGSYDAKTRRVTWTIPSLAAGESGCVELVVQVKAGTPTGTIITNEAVIDSDQSEATTAGATATVRLISDEPLLLTKTVVSPPGVGSGEGTLCVYPGEEVTYAICFESRSEEIFDDVLIVDSLSRYVTFVSADGDGKFGYYDRDNHTYTWTYDAIYPGEAGCVALTVVVNDDVVPGTTVNNTVTVEGTDGPIAETGVGICVEEAPLRAEMTVSPLILGRQHYNRSEELTAVLVFADNIKPEDIDKSASLRLYPGAIAATSAPGVTIVNGKTQVAGGFPLDQVVDAIPENGLTTLRVVGRLQSQRSFVGEAVVLVVGERPF